MSNKGSDEDQDNGEEESSSSEESLPPLEPKTFGRSNRGRLMGKMLDIKAPKTGDSFWDEHADEFAESEEDNEFDAENDEDASK